MRLPQTGPHIAPVLATETGFLSSCQTRDLGMVVVGLGGGRRHPSDVIDHRVGMSHILPLGTKVEKGQSIALVHAATQESLAKAIQDVSDAYGLSQEASGEQPIIVSRIGA